MNRPIESIRSQTGQVAVIVAIVIALLIIMIGLVVDLGFLYTRKTELQNAADAAALAGAKQLNGTAAGISAAVTAARDMAELNSVDFGGDPIEIEDAQIKFGPHPDGPWSSPADAQGAPADKLYIKVDTSGILQGSHPTWFMRVAGFDSTATYGMAVAGRTVCEGLPIFTCATGPAPNYGFEPGASYYLAEPPNNSDIGPGYVGWMNIGNMPGVGNPEDGMRLLLCIGQGQCLTSGSFTSITQSAEPQMMRALNTRFNQYSGVFNGMRDVCPSDANVKQYTPAVASAWMEPSPTTQIEVKWTAVRPTGALSGYPSAPDTPYSSTSSPWFEAPLNPDVPPQEGRRILTIGIATNCPIEPGHGNAEVATFARFLMQVPGVDTGSNKGFFGEFIETIPSAPPIASEIKLFR